MYTPKKKKKRRVRLADEPRVKVRLQCQDPEELEFVRQLFLERCPELILASPREGTNPKYAGRQKWASYGDFIINTIRRRRK